MRKLGMTNKELGGLMIISGSVLVVIAFYFVDWRAGLMLTGAWLAVMGLIAGSGKER